MAYIGKSPSQGVRNRFQYQATAGQTSFSGSDANSLTLTYTDSLYLDVYQNGTHTHYLDIHVDSVDHDVCLLYTSPSPRDVEESRFAGCGV